MKRAKKLLCLLLTLCILLSVAPVTSLAAEKARYTVVLLDTERTFDLTYGGETIYSVTTPIETIKQAAKKFVEQIQTADGTNYLAIVSYSNVAVVETDFTTDTSKLNSSISDIEIAGQWANINDAFKKADMLLDGVNDPNASKNIVLFTQGIPTEGEYSTGSRYSNDDLSWIRNDNSVKLYQYANAAYNTAASLMKKYNVYSIGLFQSFGSVPEEGRPVLNFAKKFSSDLQNAGFRNVDNVDDLKFAFIDVAEDIIEPLGVALSNKKVNEFCFENVGGQLVTHKRYIYELHAEITNKAASTAKNVVCTLELPEEVVPLNEMVSAKETAVKNVGDIEPGETEKVVWKIEIKHPKDETSAIYKVHAVADNTVSITQFDIIYIDTYSSNNNELVFGKDQWNFSNSNPYFDPNDNERYYINNSDLSALLNGLSNVEIERIIKCLNDGWGGSCYGMSATVILSKMGVVDASAIQKNKKSLYEISKQNNDDVESFINYYHACQKLDILRDRIATVSSMSEATVLELLEKETQKVSGGGTPVFLVYTWKTGAHAVVAYAHEAGSWSYGGFLGMGAKKYDSRILIYDPNSPQWDPDYCLYYNKGTGEHYFPHYHEKYGDADIIFFSSDINLIDPKNYEVSTSNYSAWLTSQNLYEYTISGSGLNRIPIGPQYNNADIGIYTYHSPGVTVEGMGSPEMNCILPDNDSVYTIYTDDAQDFELSIDYEDSRICVNAQSASSLTFNPSGALEAKELNGQYDLALVFNEGHHETPWYKTTVSGSDAEEVKLEQTEDGILVESDNLRNMTVTTKDDNREETVTFSTDQDAALITANKEDAPVVLTDTDNDGVFETEVTKEDDTQSRPTSKLPLWIMGAGEQKHPFLDVSKSDWFYDDVQNAWENDLIDGVTASEFRPYETLTVAQAIKLAAALHQLDTMGYVTLSNGYTNWYDTYVDYAVNNGIIESKYASYTKAQMNASVNRGEFVHIFYGAMSNYAQWNSVADNAIPDVKLSDKYASEIYTFYRAGILTGNDAAGTFAPNSSIKRSEVAAILSRMYDTSVRQYVSLS